MRETDDREWSCRNKLQKAKKYEQLHENNGCHFIKITWVKMLIYYKVWIKISNKQMGKPQKSKLQKEIIASKLSQTTVLK